MPIPDNGFERTGATELTTDTLTGVSTDQLAAAGAFTRGVQTSSITLKQKEIELNALYE